MKYYIGIDSSTSCTGIAVIDENNNLIFYDYCYTKDNVKKANSLGEEFDIIYDSYLESIVSKLFCKIPNGLIQENEFYWAIEANSFGGYNTTMLLGITIGLMHGIAKHFGNYKGIKYSAVGNWRSKILDTDPTDDMTNVRIRNELKKYIADWAERTYNIKLPLFTNKYDGILINETYDMRINDISDAIGLAYCCKNNLLSDRKQLKVQTRKDNNEIRSMKNSAKRYKKLVEDWFKRWKKEKNNSNKKSVLQHCNTLQYYLDELKKKNNLSQTMENWYNKINNIRKEIE